MQYPAKIRWMRPQRAARRISGLICPPSRAPLRAQAATSGRRPVSVPESQNLDLSLFKTFDFAERYKLQFRSEWLNMSNTPRFAVSSIGNTQGAGNFGRLSATLPGTARNVQFALRFMF